MEVEEEIEVDEGEKVHSEIETERETERMSFGQDMV